MNELRKLWTHTRHAWSEDRRPWLGAVVAGWTLAVWVVLGVRGVGPELWRVGDVYAALPLQTEIWRLPMSLFLPTPFLPIWAAAGQLLVVIGLGEMLLGRLTTVVIAFIGHVGVTLGARLAIELGHGHVAGLTMSVGHLLDTGPSAATAAVGTCVLEVLGLRRWAVVLGVALLIAAIVAPGIDGLEHMLAFTFGLVAAAGLASARLPASPAIPPAPADRSMSSTVSDTEQRSRARSDGWWEPPDGRGYAPRLHSSLASFARRPSVVRITSFLSVRSCSRSLSSAPANRRIRVPLSTTSVPHGAARKQ